MYKSRNSPKLHAVCIQQSRKRRRVSYRHCRCPEAAERPLLAPATPLQVPCYQNPKLATCYLPTFSYLLETQCDMQEVNKAISKLLI